MTMHAGGAKKGNWNPKPRGEEKSKMPTQAVHNVSGHVNHGHSDGKSGHSHQKSGGKGKSSHGY